MLKRITLTLALLICGTAYSQIPKNPTRQQIIASLAVPSVAERVALRTTKTRLEAAETLESIYRERLHTDESWNWDANLWKLSEVTVLIETLEKKNKKK